MPIAARRDGDRHRAAVTEVSLVHRPFACHARDARASARRV
jgi:hypothetical protein